MSLIDTLPRTERVSADELRAARDILLRKALSDTYNRDVCDATGQPLLADGYRARIEQLYKALEIVEDCMEGILPGC